MNTVAHIMVASAVLARRDMPKRNWAVVAGALLPDFSIYVFFAWSRIMGWSGPETWDVRYWTEPWQTFGAISNSFILFGIILAVAMWRKWPWIVVGCGAVLLHLAFDLPLHADDAHRHFWPVTDWRFISPVSYWDPRHHGLIGAGIETVTVLICAAVLWQRFSRIWVRVLVSFVAALQAAMLTGAIIYADRLAVPVNVDAPHTQDIIGQIEKAPPR